MPYLSNRVLQYALHSCLLVHTGTPLRCFSAATLPQEKDMHIISRHFFRNFHTARVSSVIWYSLPFGEIEARSPPLCTGSVIRSRCGNKIKLPTGIFSNPHGSCLSEARPLVPTDRLVPTIPEPSVRHGSPCDGKDTFHSGWTFSKLFLRGGRSFPAQSILPPVHK